MTSSFERYTALLAHDFVTFETRAACGGLIVEDARMKYLMAQTHAMGHEDGPLSAPEWMAHVQKCRQAYKQFDAAWAAFLAGFTRETWLEHDDRLRLVIMDCTRQLQDLLADIPIRQEILRW